MKIFSKTMPITLANLKKVPDDKPGVVRMKNKDGKILCILRASNGRLAERIYEHRGGMGDCRAASFQYRTTSDWGEAERLADEEVQRRILPFAWRWEQRQLRKRQHAK